MRAEVLIDFDLKQLFNWISYAESKLLIPTRDGLTANINPKYTYFIVLTDAALIR